MAAPSSNSAIKMDDELRQMLDNLHVPKWFIERCEKLDDFCDIVGGTKVLNWHKAAESYYSLYVMDGPPPPGRENQWRGFPRPIILSHDPTTILPKAPQPPPP